MQPLTRRYILPLTLAVGIAGFGDLPNAAAQGLPNAPPGMGAPGLNRGGGDSKAKPVVPPPDAIPGSKARQPVAPATRASSDMDPNDALFDAINRGDIAAARDALNRGADLNAVNVLGMTPMELSVDLGRNDISFLLLSMRGEDGGRGSGRSAGGGSRGNTIGTPAASAAKPPVATRQAAAPAVRVSAPKPPPAPKLWANDGGTPQPSAGFLGFGSRQASN